MRPISGRFRAASMKRAACSRQVLRRSAAAVLQLHREAGAGAEPGDGGGPEGHDARFGNLLRERPVQRRDHAVGVRLLGGAAPPTA